MTSSNYITMFSTGSTTHLIDEIKADPEKVMEVISFFDQNPAYKFYKGNETFYEYFFLTHASNAIDNFLSRSGIFQFPVVFLERLTRKRNIFPFPEGVEKLFPRKSNVFHDVINIIRESWWRNKSITIPNHINTYYPNMSEKIEYLMNNNIIFATSNPHNHTTKRWCNYLASSIN